MAGSTPNYGLHQWEPTDQFLRTDFNQDLSAIDTALAQVKQRAEYALSALEPVSYNIYNLMLQNDYEGKYTGYKKALIFDGFTDESGIAEKSASIIVRNNSLYLGSTAQEDQTFSYEQEHRVNGGGTAVLTATGSGYFTALTFYANRYDSMAAEHTVYYTVYRNSAAVEQGSIQVTTNTTLTTHRLTLRMPLPVLKGDQLYVQLSVSGNYFFYCIGLREDPLACIYHFTGATGTQGSMTAVPVEVPECAHVLAWVRHSGGDTALSLFREGSAVSIPLISCQSAQTLEGQTCMESAFQLDQPMQGQLALKLELTRREAEMRVYDYGLIWI